MKPHKGPTVTIGILLTVSMALLVRGMVGDPFCWFSGLKLLVTLALISIWAKQFGEDSIIQKIFAGFGEISSLLVGVHLLVPHFWPTIFAKGPYLLAFFVCSGLAWLYSFAAFEKEDFGCSSYELFFYLPIFVFVGSFLATAAFAGPLYAAMLLMIYYFALGGLFLQEGLSFKNGIYFNFGLMLLSVVLLAMVINLGYWKYLNWQIVLAVCGLIVLMNVWFNIRKRKMRRSKK